MPVLGCSRQRHPAIARIVLHVGSFSSSSFTTTLCPFFAAYQSGVRQPLDLHSMPAPFSSSSPTTASCPPSPPLPSSPSLTSLGCYRCGKGLGKNTPVRCHSTQVQRFLSQGSPFRRSPTHPPPCSLRRMRSRLASSESPSHHPPGFCRRAEGEVVHPLQTLSPRHLCRWRFQGPKRDALIW